MSQFTKGQKVFRYYTAEPSFIYGPGRVKEDGVILGDPIEFDGKSYIPVKWQYDPYHPELSLEGTIHSYDGETTK